MPRVRKVTEHTAKKKIWKIGIYIRLSRENKSDDRTADQRGKRGSPQNVAADSSGSIIEQDKLLTEWVLEYFRDQDLGIVVPVYRDRQALWACITTMARQKRFSRSTQMD